MRNLLQAFIILSFITFGSACAGLSKIATNVPTQTTEGGQGGDNPYNGSGLTEHGDETEGAEETAEGADDDGEDAMDPSNPSDGSDEAAEGSDGTTEVAVAETEEGTSSDMPVTVAPAPTSENATPTNDTECVYVGATDEEEELPIVASEDCVYCLDMETGERVECDPEDWILVASDSELDTETAMLDIRRGKARLAPTLMAKVLNWFLPFGEGVFSTANADDTDSPEPEICSEEGISCCNITPTGSFECFHDRTADNRDDDVYLYFIKKNSDEDEDGVIDENAVIAEGTIETPNANILYTMQAAVHSAQGADSNIYTLASSRGLELMDDGRWFVKGDHLANYEKFEASASKLTFDKDNETFGLMSSADGIGLYSLADGDLGTMTADALSYTTIKETINGPMFGVETTSTENAYIYNAYDGTASYLGLDPHPGAMYPDYIQFLFEGDGITHTKTLGFDINDDGYALVLFTDADGNYHLRMSDNSTTFGGTTALSGSFSTYDFRDIKFIDNNRAMLLDAENNKVWVILTNTGTSTVTSTLTVGLAVPKPIAIVTDSTNSMAYVLSESSNRVFAVSIGSRPEVVGSIGLGDVFGKPFNFKPTTLALSEDDTTVLVGCDNKIKSTLVVDMSPLAVAPGSGDPGNTTGGTTGGSSEQPSGSNNQQPGGGGGITSINPNMPHL